MDYDSRKPIQGVKIALYQDEEPLIEVFTNRSGRYKINDVLVGEYELVFSKSDYETERIEQVSIQESGKTISPKTKISDEYGYCAEFADISGNKMGLWSKK